MNTEEALALMRAQADEGRRASAERLGVPAENSLGVPTAALRRLAKRLGRSNALARGLWDSGWHEARLLAALVCEPEGLTRAEVERMMGEVASWDLCDHLCKELVIKRGDWEGFMRAWAEEDGVYKKRAAFTLIAAAAVHRTPLPMEKVEGYLALIRAHARDSRPHVKKAASWAIRELGKSGPAEREAALAAAREMLSGGDRALAWAARDAIRELENCVCVEGVRRLVPAGGKMAARAGK